MYKTDGSITSQYGDGTREDFLLTYDENEKQEHGISKNNAGLVLRPEFIPMYPNLLKQGFSLLESCLYGFIKFFLSNNDKFYCTNEQLAELFNVGETSISTGIKKLKDTGLLEIGYKIKSGGGKVRFIKLNFSTFKIGKSDFQNLKGIENKIIDIDLLPNGNKCVDTQKENLGLIDTIETQQTEKEATGQNVENYKTIEGKNVAEILKRGVTFDDVANAFPSMKNFDKAKAEKKFKEFIDSGMSIDKIFLNAFLEKLLLRVSGTDYRYVMRFDNWLNSYHEIDDEMEDAKIQEILSKYRTTKENHKYKESVYSVLEDVLGKERVRPIFKNITKMTLIVDGKILNQ